MLGCLLIRLLLPIFACTSPRYCDTHAFSIRTTSSLFRAEALVPHATSFTLPLASPTMYSPMVLCPAFVIMVLTPRESRTRTTMLMFSIPGLRFFTGVARGSNPVSSIDIRSQLGFGCLCRLHCAPAFLNYSVALVRQPPLHHMLSVVKTRYDLCTTQLPITTTSTSRRVLGPSISTKNMFCQVPLTSLPFKTGNTLSVPMNVEAM